MRRLEHLGCTTRPLIALTADHGLAWQAGVETRRSVSAPTWRKSRPVPFIVKAPGQRRGAGQRRVRADARHGSHDRRLLGLRLGYRADGRSAFSRAVRRRPVRAPQHAGLRGDGEHLRPALGGAPPPGGPAPACGSWARATGRASTPGSARTGAPRALDRRVWPAPPRPGCGREHRPRGHAGRGAQGARGRAGPDRRRPPGRRARRQAGHRGVGERANRGRGPLLLPGRRSHRALRGDGAGGGRCARDATASRCSRSRPRRGAQRLLTRPVAGALRCLVCRAFTLAWWHMASDPRRRVARAGRGGLRRRRAAPAGPERPPVVMLVFDEFPADDAAAARTAASTPSAIPTSPRSPGSRPGTPTAPPCSTRPSARCRPSSTPGCPRWRGGRRAQPPAQHLPADEPARVRDHQGGVRQRGMPSADLRRRPRPAPEHPRPAGRRRAARAPAPLDRSGAPARRARPSTSTTRSSPTSPGSTCPPATATGRPARTRSEA